MIKTLLKRVGLPLVSLMVLALPAAAADARKVKGDQNTYRQRVKQLGAIQQRLETGGTMRVWRATAAGRSVGSADKPKMTK